MSSMTHETIRKIDHPIKGPAVAAWIHIAETVIGPSIEGNTVFETSSGVRFELTPSQVESSLRRLPARRSR